MMGGEKWEWKGQYASAKNCPDWVARGGVSIGESSDEKGCFSREKTEVDDEVRMFLPKKRRVRAPVGGERKPLTKRIRRREKGKIAIETLTRYKPGIERKNTTE